MGFVLKAVCPKCGTEFCYHMGDCLLGLLPAGMEQGCDGFFRCPNCNYLFDPTDEDYPNHVSQIGAWQ